MSLKIYFEKVTGACGEPNPCSQCWAVPLLALTLPHSPFQQVEARALGMFRDIAQQLQSTCVALGASIQGLPGHVREQAQQARSQVDDLQATFSSIHSFQDLTAGVLAQTRERIARAREALDHTVEYVAQNTPVTWLVGPFAPGITEKALEEKK